MFGMQLVAGRWCWFALSALALVMASSCSSTDRDFDSGEGHSGGAGGDPSSGDGASDNGGSSSKPDDDDDVSPSDGGGAGTENAGELSVVSTTPDDRAIAVECDGVVEVVFSADIDQASVTAASFRVEGPLGAVTGEIDVTGDKVTFTPSKPLSLLAEYTVTLSSDIRSTGDAELTEYELGFQTRDGVFGKPERLTTLDAVNLHIEGSRMGHVGAIWNDGLTPASTYAAIFDPITKTWGEATAVESDTKNAYSFACLGFNDLGEAFTVAGSSVAAWNRFDGTKWGAASMTGVTQTRACALSGDGTAMTTWTDSSGGSSKAVASFLSPNDTWSEVATLQTGATRHELAPFGAGFIALYKVTAENAIYSRVYDATNGWQPPSPVTPKDASPNYWNLATNETTALFTWWDASGVAKAALFDGTSWSNEELGPVNAGTHARVGDKGHIAAWFYQGNAYLARYDLQSGWEDPVKLGASDGELHGPAAEVDSSGNALAAFGSGSSIIWRRRPYAAAEWSASEEVKDQDPGGYVVSRGDIYGNVMFVWTNPLGVWASRFE